MDHLKLLAELVAIPGPPGQEELVAEAVKKYCFELGFSSDLDAKGNLIVQMGTGKPNIVVTAHMDEIAMIVRSVGEDGRLSIGSLGGLFPWKLGEGPVDILAPQEIIPGVLSFGSIHSADPRNSARAAASGPLEWEMTRVFTGRSYEELIELGVRPGTRVVVAKRRRELYSVGELVSSHFLDDRADLVSMILTLELLKGFEGNVSFVASASEEVGGEGALFYLQGVRPDICIALELGPNVEDAPVMLTDQPTVWVNDSYSAMKANDVTLVEKVGKQIGQNLQFQALSRGGSDASCAASHGLCGRPFTLGLPMSNSHGFEIMHPHAMVELARLTAALIRELS